MYVFKLFLPFKSDLDKIKPDLEKSGILQNGDFQSKRVCLRKFLQRNRNNISPTKEGCGRGENLVAVAATLA